MEINVILWREDGVRWTLLNSTLLSHGAHSTSESTWLPHHATLRCLIMLLLYEVVLDGVVASQISFTSVVAAGRAVPGTSDCGLL